MIKKLNIEVLLDEAKEEQKGVTDEVVLKALADADSKTNWKDDFESSWKPLSEDDFFAKYPSEWLKKG